MRVDVAPAPAEEDEAGALPEFLSDDEERHVAADDDRPPNEITSRDDSGRPAFFVTGGRRTTSAPIFIAEGSRGRAGPGRV